MVLKQIIYAVGLYKVGTSIYRFGYSRKNLMTDSHLETTYGQGEWAIVTGASEGIGREYALQLAKAGFNLTLVSRTKANLDQVVSECRHINPVIKTTVVPLDISTATGSDFQNLFGNRTSIVVNNAGRMDREKLFVQDPSSLESMLKTNLLPYCLLTKYATLHFKETKQAHNHKVAIVSTSSIASDQSFPYQAVYGATKRFNEVFATQIRFQYRKSHSLRDLIDHQVLKPSITTTRMAGFKGGLLTSQPSAVVKGSLADLGKQPVVYGSTLHNYQGLSTPVFINAITAPLVCRYFGKMTTDFFKHL